MLHIFRILLGGFNALPTGYLVGERKEMVGVQEEEQEAWYSICMGMKLRLWSSHLAQLNFVKFLLELLVETLSQDTQQFPF